MANRSGKSKQQRGQQLNDMESFLQSKLKPVSPRPEFIQSLQKGLMDYSFPSPDEEEADLRKTIFFAFFGFAGLVFVFSLWIRLILIIISTVGMLQTSKRRRLLNR